MKVPQASLSAIALLILTASSTANASGAGLGALYPGARLVKQDQKSDCKARYVIQTPSSYTTVGDFYLQQGREAGLTLVEDTNNPDFRMIAFGEKPPKRMLFVIVDREQTGARATVLYSQPDSSCDQR